MSVNYNVNEFSCSSPDCGYSTTKEEKLILHMRSHFVFEIPRLSKVGNLDLRKGLTFTFEDGKYICSACNLLMMGAMPFREHIRHHIMRYPYKCGVCLKAMKTIPFLRTHFSEMHPKCSVELLINDVNLVCRKINNIIKKLLHKPYSVSFPLAVVESGSSATELRTCDSASSRVNVNSSLNHTSMGISSNTIENYAVEPALRVIPGHNASEQFTTDTKKVNGTERKMVESNVTDSQPKKSLINDMFGKFLLRDQKYICESCNFHASEELLFERHVFNHVHNTSLRNCTCSSMNSLGSNISNCLTVASLIKMLKVNSSFHVNVPNSIDTCDNIVVHSAPSLATSKQSGASESRALTSIAISKSRKLLTMALSSALENQKTTAVGGVASNIPDVRTPHTGNSLVDHETDRKIPSIKLVTASSTENSPKLLVLPPVSVHSADDLSILQSVIAGAAHCKREVDKSVRSLSIDNATVDKRLPRPVQNVSVHEAAETTVASVLNSTRPEQIVSSHIVTGTPALNTEDVNDYVEIVHHSTPLKEICLKCSFTCNNEKQLDAHQRLCGKEPTKECDYVCHDCKFGTNHKEIFTWHKVHHLNERPVSFFTCSLCKKQSSRRQCIVNHIAEAHPQDTLCKLVIHSETLKYLENIVRCPICPDALAWRVINTSTGTFHNTFLHHLQLKHKLLTLHDYIRSNYNSMQPLPPKVIRFPRHLLGDNLLVYSSISSLQPLRTTATPPLAETSDLLLPIAVQEISNIRSKDTVIAKAKKGKKSQIKQFGKKKKVPTATLR